MKTSAGKILIIVQNLPVPFDRRVWLEAQKLKDNGYGVSVICPRSKENPEKFIRLDGISIYRYTMPVDAQGLLGYIFEFLYAWIMTALLSVRILVKEGFDVIQACNPPDTFFLLGLIYKAFGKKYVFDHHDLAPEMYLAKYDRNGGFLYKALLLLERSSLKSADVIMTTNRSYKQKAIERGKRNEEDIFVLRTGPDLERLRIQPVDEKLKKGKSFLVCYLGEMCPQDGVDYLLKSVQYIHDELGRTDIQFTMIGGGPAQPDFKKMSEDMGQQAYVNFTGRLPDDDLCRYLSSADVCVDPDPLTEWSNYSTMNKILEYMAFAKPIVSFDLVESRYSADDAALYAQPNDIQEFGRHITYLLDNPAQSKQMGKFGYERVRNKLSWAHTNKALIEAYEHVFAKQRNNRNKKSKTIRARIIPFKKAAGL